MIETNRLILRHVEMKDVKDIFEYATDKDTGPMAGWVPHEQIRDTELIVRMWLSPRCIEEVFAIVDKGSDKTIGTMGVLHLNDGVKDEKNIFINELIAQGKSAYEVGVTLSKDYWGMGIATEGFRAMKEYLFEDRNADVVVTCHYEANMASGKVQEKSGMNIIGLYDRDKKWHNTDCTTMVVRGQTREDWRAEKELTQ